MKATLVQWAEWALDYTNNEFQRNTDAIKFGDSIKDREEAINFFNELKKSVMENDKYIQDKLEKIKNFYLNNKPSELFELDLTRR